MLEVFFDNGEEGDMTTMTVTDALAELTLLEKRINSARVALDNNTLIAVVEVGKVPTGRIWCNGSM